MENHVPRQQFINLKSWDGKFYFVRNFSTGAISSGWSWLDHTFLFLSEEIPPGSKFPEEAGTHTHTHRHTCNHTVSVRLVSGMTWFSTKMYVHTFSRRFTGRNKKIWSKRQRQDMDISCVYVTVTLYAWVCDGSPEHRVTDIDDS